MFVPFDDGNEVEQGIRANALARSAGIEVVTSDALTDQTLLAAVTRAIADGGARQKHTQMFGAETSVEIVAQMVREQERG